MTIRLSVGKTQNHPARSEPMGTARTDDRGRLYLPRELRDRYGTEFHVVRYQDHVRLIPIPDDPAAVIRDEVGDAFDGKSIDELRDEARQQAIEDAEEHIR
ncbi:AbrB/MazE/SpoVT family DNA-binding domain-containing protein [Halegenticoccus soli]|uniref:AbrB/MazE/SpoVT family DNA-binding domain-containing protein n=1 Tax=Halegenticoccus soli TaxID=1985678 RepID=UPI001E51213D|nr:AbrB/MazE/SpoVT family DNA-binding domain-containing protein [Halegenticoccus soli]